MFQRYLNLKSTLSLNFFQQSLGNRTLALSSFEGKQENDVEVAETPSRSLTVVPFKRLFPIEDENDSDATELEDDMEEEKFQKDVYENSFSAKATETKSSQKDISRIFDMKVFFFPQPNLLKSPSSPMRLRVHPMVNPVTLCGKGIGKVFKILKSSNVRPF